MKFLYCLLVALCLYTGARAHATVPAMPTALALHGYTQPVQSDGMHSSNTSSDDIPFVIGLITVGVGAVVLLSGTIVRAISKNTKGKENGKIVQGIGTGLIVLSPTIALSNPNKSLFSKRTKKVRGFKRRHHYY